MVVQLDFLRGAGPHYAMELDPTIQLAQLRALRLASLPKLKLGRGCFWQWRKYMAWIIWEPLGTSGYLWEPLGTSGSLWEPLGASGII